MEKIERINTGAFKATLPDVVERVKTPEATGHHPEEQQGSGSFNAA